jgi:hypothetical protein
VSSSFCLSFVYFYFNPEDFVLYACGDQLQNLSPRSSRASTRSIRAWFQSFSYPRGYRYEKAQEETELFMGQMCERGYVLSAAQRKVVVSQQVPRSRLRLRVAALLSVMKTESYGEKMELTPRLERGTY